LKAIVDEHLDYPDESLEDMLEILNVDILSKPKKYILTNLYKVTKDSKKKLANGTIPKAEYEEINFVNAELEIYSVEQDRYKVSIYTEQEKPSENSPTSQNMPNNNMVMFGGRDNNSRGENIQFNISNLTSKDGATHEFIVGDYKIIMVKAEPGKINEAIEKSK